MKFSLSNISFLKPRRSFGIDLGTRAFKGVELRRGTKGLVLERFFFADFGPRMHQMTPIEKSRNLSTLLEVHEMSGKKVYGALPDAQVSVFNLQFPPMPNDEIRSAVMHEMANRLAFPVTEAVFDYSEPRPSVTEKGQKVLDLRAFCSRREVLNGVIATLASSHLKLLAIDSEILANIAVLQHGAYIHEKSKPSVVLDFGNGHCTAALIVGGEALFVNVVLNGNDRLRHEIAQAFSIDAGVAEKLARGERAGLDFDWQSLEDLCLEHDRVLLGEILHSVEFFREHLGVHTLEDAFVLGAPHAVDRIGKLIPEFLGLRPQVVDPLRNFELGASIGEKNADFGIQAPYLTVALGAALRGLAA